MGARNPVRHERPHFVRFHRRFTATFKPPIERRRTDQRAEHHLFVIAAEHRQLALGSQGDEPVNHATRIGAAIDDIAQNHQLIGRLEFQRAQHGVER